MTNTKRLATAAFLLTTLPIGFVTAQTPVVTKDGPSTVVGVKIQNPDLQSQKLSIATAQASAYKVLGSEMSFDAKVIKGAPFSANSVSESVQVLGDGNRIVQSSSTSIYRDGEGRTRREENLSGVKQPTTEGPIQVVFINDPVTGFNYVLNSNNHTASKMPTARVILDQIVGGNLSGGEVAATPRTAAPAMKRSLDDSSTMTTFRVGPAAGGGGVMTRTGGQNPRRFPLVHRQLKAFRLKAPNSPPRFRPERSATNNRSSSNLRAGIRPICRP